jgi:hypothetical protein
MAPGGKDGLYIGIIAVLFGVFGYFFFSNITGNAADVNSPSVQNVKAIYELLTSDKVEIMKVTDESGLYKVSVRFNDATGRSTLQDVYITKDGKLITASVIDTKEYTKTLSSDRRFAQCLSDKGVIIFGSSSDQTTLVQLQMLGEFSGLVFFDCAKNPELCQQVGVQSVPATVYENQSYTGLQTKSFYEGLTGCSYNSTG